MQAAGIQGAMTHRLLVGNWNEPFLLVACLGNMLQRVGVEEGTNLRNAALFRDEKYLRAFDTGSPDGIAKLAARFRRWACDGFAQPFGLEAVEAEALYSLTAWRTKQKVGYSILHAAPDDHVRTNINAMIKRWVIVDIVDPGMPIEVGHFEHPPSKRVKPRRNLPRDVRTAVDAYLLAYEPGHARAYVDSWKRAQEEITP